jgi:HlyD family secretion protein
MEQRVAKGTELEMVLATAQADQEAATAKVQFAKDQRSLVDQGSQTIESLRQQVDRLRQLTEDPLTKPLVGTLQLEQQKAQLLQEELRWNSSVAEADQAIAAAELAVKLATQRTANAQKNLQLADSLVPVRSLEAQVKSLEEQLERLRVTAPSSGEVLWVGSEPGELVGQMPLMEIADLSQMVCVAEVHESDRARLRIGQAAAIRSAALSKPLVGKIERIDRLIPIHWRAPTIAPFPSAFDSNRPMLPQRPSWCNCRWMWKSLPPRDMCLASTMEQGDIGGLVGWKPASKRNRVISC